MKIAIYSIIISQILLNTLTTVAESQGNRNNAQENRQESSTDSENIELQRMKVINPPVMQRKGKISSSRENGEGQKKY
ncbi:hypothetical protein CY0110_14565 [Crocosphaera chwakensis CCY0110]|uniref:Uncharacterized protein n=1 Tax=Crocosphaera chwakensis CCY0110 TaxID=391612 RepID=A3IZ18_9CHRO|nr:hypothetical protein CY0110_14565 [Crocosphaera chwakensis CCY0110]